MTFASAYKLAWNAFHAGNLEECARLLGECRQLKTNSTQSRRVAALWGFYLTAKAAVHDARWAAEEVSP
jgi:hypothetical protein